MKIVAISAVLLALMALFHGTVSAQEAVEVAGERAPVKGFTGRAMLTTAQFKWDAVGGEGKPEPVGYRIYRREENGEYGEPAAIPGPITRWTDYGLDKGKRYFYRITAYYADGTESKPTSDLATETWVKPPFMPFIGEMPIRRIPTLDVLCAIYHGGMEKGSAERVKTAFEAAREFIWRNSRCRLNLRMAYVFIDEDAQAGGEDMAEIEKDLRKRGYVDDQFDAVFAAGPAIKTTKGGYVILGSTAGAMGWNGPTEYAGGDPTLDRERVWVFTKAFYESLDKVIAEKSGHSELPDADFERNYGPDKDVQFDGGRGFDGIAHALRAFDGYGDFKAPWDGYIEVGDMDDDGIPDNDERVPLDERRFLSDPRYKDTDNDYLDDIDEMVASAWWGSRNIVRDNDGDGLLDGKDPFPLVDFKPAIQKVLFVPTIDGRIEDTWRELSVGYFWSKEENQNVRSYAGWDEKYLYFAFKSEKKLNVHLEIDGSGENGRWEGGDTYELVVARDSPAVTCNGKAVDGLEAAHWIGDDGAYQTELKIPAALGRGFGYVPEGKEVAGLVLEPGRVTGLSLTLRNPEDPDDVVYITDLHGQYKVTLEK